MWQFVCLLYKRVRPLELTCWVQSYYCQCRLWPLKVVWTKLYETGILLHRYFGLTWANKLGYPVFPRQRQRQKDTSQSGICLSFKEIKLFALLRNGNQYFLFSFLFYLFQISATSNMSVTGNPSWEAEQGKTFLTVGVNNNWVWMVSLFCSIYQQ